MAGAAGTRARRVSTTAASQPPAPRIRSTRVAYYRRSLLLILAFAAALLSAAACTRPAPVTFSDDVAPILAARCVSCHHRAWGKGELPGYAVYGTAAGISPFSLETLSSAQTHAAQLLFFVQERSMPPWDPEESGDCQTFRDSARLTDAELSTLTSWITYGMPEKAGASTVAVAPPLPSFAATTSLSLGVFTLSTSMFPGGGPTPADQYRCRNVDSVGGGLLTAWAVTAGTPHIVESVIAYLVTAPSATLSTALDFNCAETPPGPAPLPAESEYFPVATWVPGDAPASLAVPIRIPPGSHLLVRVHYNLKDTLRTDQDTRIAFQYAGSGGTATRTVLADTTSGTISVPLSALGGPASLWAVSPDLHQSLTGGNGQWQTGLAELVHSDGTKACLLSTLPLNVPWSPWRRIYQYQTAIPVTPQDTLRYTCAGPGRCTLYGYFQ